MTNRPLFLALVFVGCASSSAHGDGQMTTASNASDRAPMGLPLPPPEPPEETGPAGKIDTPTREAVPMAGSELVHGRSTVLVEAPIAKVREAVLDFDRYAEFMPHYRQSRVLSRQPDGTSELYMQIEALHGAVKMWARVAMPPPRKDGDAEVHESRFIDGNVKDFVAIWRLRPLDERRTELSLQVFLQPKLPMPSSVLNEENLDGAVKGVTAMRERIAGAS